MAKEDLKPVRTKEEAKERGRRGGIKSGEVRRAKKNMRDMAKYLMESDVSKNMKGVINTLEQMGVGKDDQTYQAAVVVRLMQKAITEGDTQSVRLLGELTGDLGKDFLNSIDNDPNIIDMEYPPICIPDNGRDKVTKHMLRPQAGPQTMFLSTSADICVYGGAAGGGKTYGILLEGLRHKDVRGFDGVILRTSNPQITAPGGLWDSSQLIYGFVPDAVPKKSPKYHWSFNGGMSKITFAALASDKDLLDWQGTQITFLGFDELTHFTQHQFLYMLSRNRTTCGVKPYVRATCNPDADSWVADFISWWIDQDTGYPIKERSGQLRYMLNINDSIKWGDSPEELAEKYDVPVEDCKSVTFIASSIEDNKILLETDPSYMSNLKALTEVDMERLLYGNWKIKASAGRYFQRAQIPTTNYFTILPDDIIFYCRAWDLAATDEDENGEADYTAGVLMGKRKNGHFIIIDVINKRVKAGDVETLIQTTALIDRQKYGFNLMIRVPQDPGAAGKIVAKQYVNMLAGYSVKAEPVSGSKELRATPLAAQWQQGFVDIMVAEWNEEYLNQMESFPESKHDDMVDASSDAFNQLADDNFNLDNLL